MSDDKFDLPFDSPVEPIRLQANDELKFKCHPGVSCWNACCSKANVTLLAEPKGEGAYLMLAPEKLGIPEDGPLTAFCGVLTLDVGRGILSWSKSRRGVGGV